MNMKLFDEESNLTETVQSALIMIIHISILPFTPSTIVHCSTIVQRTLKVHMAPRFYKF